MGRICTKGTTWATSQSGKRFRTKAMRAQKVHISFLPFSILVSPILGQLQFNGGVSSSSNRNTNRPTSGDVDEKFFLGGDSPSLTGRDNTGRTWCYTTGWSNNCGDLQTSKRYPNNPWSYT